MSWTDKLAIEDFKKNRWLWAKCETNTGVCKKDGFGFADYVCVCPETHERMLIQVTSKKNVKARHKKILAEYASFRLLTHFRIFVWGYEKNGTKKQEEMTYIELKERHEHTSYEQFLKEEQEREERVAAVRRERGREIRNIRKEK